jgi:DNA invertase Pin-like site-specific DNA recombinase
MAIKGYARVSTDGRTLEAQQEALRKAGAEQVFAEKQSGAKKGVGAVLSFARAWRHVAGDEA